MATTNITDWTVNIHSYLPGDANCTRHAGHHVFGTPMLALQRRLKKNIKNKISN